MIIIKQFTKENNIFEYATVAINANLHTNIDSSL